ncbi:MAG: selenide, water dikinase SelD [Bacteroidetes bacterium B1(2017)]|nr:MAG: selenide, water dikinase SelD [Bacteroidetes bacterium B1(2017)]
MTDYKLTEYSHKAGCGCKIAPADLEKILSQRSGTSFKELLVGNNSNDDAAVWDLGTGMSVINTVDFFMPIVNDAYDFGRIASANAISDIYAMGGKPIFANALLGWPMETLPLELAGKVMDGARKICEDAGIPIAGGHSIDSKEPLFGLTVTGLVRTENLKRNNTPEIGDVLILTKQLGTGILGTAIKRKAAKEEHAKAAIDSMCKLNSVGAALSQITEVHALTDVTGFGLLGHLMELCSNQVSAEIVWSQVPSFPFLDEYLALNIMPDNTTRNWNSHELKVDGLIDLKAFQVLNDPQTSGGLLISVAPSKVNEVMALLNADGLNHAAIIGAILPKQSKTVLIK